jgi:hypothetical protein
MKAGKCHSKKSSSGYILFSNSRRKQLSRERPNLDSQGIVSQLAREWNSLPKSKKDSYNAIAQAERLRCQYKRKR